MNTQTESQEKQPKPKKTLWEKRIIAGRILLGSFFAMAISGVIGMVSTSIYDNDLADLEKEQNAIYEQFMASEEFSNSFKNEFTKMANDYTEGKINYDTFDEKIKYLQSVENAKAILENSNHELKDDAQAITDKIEDCKQEYQSNIIPDAALGIMSAGLISTMISGTAFMSYDFKTTYKSKIATAVDYKKENEESITK